jgi:hypothetical protein
MSCGPQRWPKPVAARQPFLNRKESFVAGYFVGLMILAIGLAWAFSYKMDKALTSCYAHRYTGAMVDWRGKTYCIRGAHGIDVVVALEYLEGQ